MSTVRLRADIQSLSPYRQGALGGPESFKLSSNENPFEPLPAVLQAISNPAINRYPDGAALALRERLGRRFGVGIDEVHIGAGSVSILAQLITAAAGPGDEVLYAWRSFEAYPGLVAIAGATSVTAPNLPDHRHDLERMAAAITERTRVVIVCSPNNPTGAVVTETEFHSFMASVPETVLVILDEAYYEFVNDPAAVRGDRLLTRYPNLVVLRTFSKAYGLAGLRVGYAVGPVDVLDAARVTAIPLAVTDQAQQAALASLDHEAELLERVGRIALLRDQVWQALVDQGWAAPRPQGNFVWLPTGEATARAAEVFVSHGIIVRAFAPEGLRVSIGESAAVDKLLRAAEEVVRNSPNLLHTAG